MATSTMIKSASGTKWGGISSDAVKKATGKDWSQWCKVLDKDKAAAMPHKDIALHIRKKYDIGDWWCQMVTVGYEQARGLRVKNQAAGGFNASVSRVMAVPITKAFKAVSDAKQRMRWLKEELTVTKATPSKSVRIAWNDGSKVVVGFWDKSCKCGNAKTQIVFQHEKLKSAAAVGRSKKFWTAKMDALAKSIGAKEPCC